MDTLTSAEETWQWSKVSCMRGAYFAHVVFCYLVFLTGIAAFVSRTYAPIKWTHVWWGRGYIISMLWATATSLIIHNSGLPPATLISFVWCLGGMCIAWVLIKFHELAMDRAAFARVQHDVAVNGLSGDLRALVAAEKGRIAASRGFWQRLLSIKAAHGAIMFVSWINIAGRIFASNQTGDFTCHTATIYKPINTPHGDFSGKTTLEELLMPAEDPDFARLPWARTGLLGWSLAMLLGPLLGALLVGGAWSLVAVRKQRRATKTSPDLAAAGEVEGGLAKGKSVGEVQLM